MPCHLDWLSTLRRNLVDVVDALAYFEAAGLDGLFVRQGVGDKVDRSVARPHRPEAVVLFVAEELGVGLVGDVCDPQIRGIAAAVVLPRPYRRMAVIDQRLSVRRVAARISPVEIHRLFLPALRGHLIQRRDARECALAAGRTEDDLRRVARPAHYIVGACMEREATRGAAGDCDDEDVVVAVAIRRERHELTVW